MSASLQSIASKTPKPLRPEILPFLTPFMRTGPNRGPGAGTTPGRLGGLVRNAGAAFTKASLLFHIPHEKPLSFDWRRAENSPVRPARHDRTSHSEATDAISGSEPGAPPLTPLRGGGTSGRRSGSTCTCRHAHAHMQVGAWHRRRNPRSHNQAYGPNCVSSQAGLSTGLRARARRPPPFPLLPVQTLLLGARQGAARHPLQYTDGGSRRIRQ